MILLFVRRWLLRFEGKGRYMALEIYSGSAINEIILKSFWDNFYLRMACKRCVHRQVLYVFILISQFCNAIFFKVWHFGAFVLISLRVGSPLGKQLFGKALMDIPILANINSILIHFIGFSQWCQYAPIFSLDPYYCD